MIIINNVQEIENKVSDIKAKQKKIGFVPTMGALHAGHIALVERARKENDVVIVSVFVNPTQFNDKKDFDKYPSTLEADSKLLKVAKCDILFAPNVKEMYPNGFGNPEPVDFGYMAKTLEGAFRPGHFDGMAQIVSKLLTIVKPDRLYMGLKDYQQQLIVGELIKKKRFKTKLVANPTKREKSGLAMSSRNARLDEHGLEIARELSKSLKLARKLLKEGELSVAQIRRKALSHLSKFKEIETEYLEIRDAGTLKPIKEFDRKAVVLVAAKTGGVRLIDNLLIPYTA
jgi:pantoate--beta-alanine ligase